MLALVPGNGGPRLLGSQVVGECRGLNPCPLVAQQVGGKEENQMNAQEVKEAAKIEVTIRDTKNALWNRQGGQMQSLRYLVWAAGSPFP